MESTFSPSGGGGPQSPDDRDRLTRTLLRLVLGAAIVTAPIFLFGEGFEAKYIGRVAASNGACIVLCLVLLRAVRAGRGALAAALLVAGLLGLVGTLAWVNGEPVHVNVVNFVLVAVLACAVGPPRWIVFVGALSAIEMVAIAWSRPGGPPGKELGEARFESIVQFLPTYLVVVGVLWLLATERGRPADGLSPR